MEEIVFLPKEKWKGTPVPLTYTNDSYYDLEISPMDRDGCTVSLVRKQSEPFTRNHHDTLYQDYWENAEAYGIVSDAGEMLACIEMCPEEWSNRLLVTELWVSEKLRGKGVGKRLMDRAKEIAAGQEYTVFWRGPDVVDITPHGEHLRLYQRDLRREKVLPKPEDVTYTGAANYGPTQQKR